MILCNSSDSDFQKVGQWPCRLEKVTPPFWCDKTVEYSSPPARRRNQVAIMSWGTELWVSQCVQGSNPFFYFMLCKLDDCMFVICFYCPWVHKNTVQNATRPISGGVLFFTAAKMCFYEVLVCVGTLIWRQAWKKLDQTVVLVQCSQHEHPHTFYNSLITQSKHTCMNV